MADVKAKADAKAARAATQRESKKAQQATGKPDAAKVQKGGPTST